ncbi:MAG: EamA family transporter [Steroidobacteraceae bacterium]
MTQRVSITAALGAAVLFGASTPVAKGLADNVSPVLLAGLLYLGSGVGLWTIRIVREHGFGGARLPTRQWPWFIGAILAGGVLGPVLLMYGLSRTSAGNASLVLNLEFVFTALLAWLVFREGADRRIVFGMAMIVAGGAVLTGSHIGTARSDWVGEIAITAACLCWALDNNLTRKISASDALFIAGTKGLISGLTNLSLAFALGAMVPPVQLTVSAMAIGLLGYGLSLVLFVIALRGLGSARTGAYFSTAPFIGAAIAIVAFGEPISVPFAISALLMGIGVWLHLTERHDHEHRHEVATHSHIHTHDLHHQHQHNFPWDGAEPHLHQHHHDELIHRHPHFPDLDHTHRH